MSVFNNLAINIACLLICFISLIYFTRILISKSVQLSDKLHIPKVLIGATVITIGSCLPDFVIAICAALQHKTDLVFGEVLGSNITNIGLVIGLTAIIIPIQISSRILRKELPILLLVVLLLGLLISDGDLGRLDGVILLLGALLFSFRSFYESIKSCLKHPFGVAALDPKIKTVPMFLIILQIIVTLIAVPSFAYGVVKSAETTAQLLNMSDFVIGLTVLAIGGALPELSVAIIGIKRKEYDLVIGTILGSSIYNILAVLAMPALIVGINVHNHLILKDFIIMAIFTILLFIFSFVLKGDGKITRFKGGILLFFFVVQLLDTFLK